MNMKNNDLINGTLEIKRIEDNKIDEVIGEMLKIEATAIGIQDDTRREIERYGVMHEQRIKEFDERLAIETEQKLETLKEHLKADKEREMLAMRGDILEYTSKMDKMYEDNHEQWVNNIVDSIIKE
jgi:transposase